MDPRAAVQRLGTTPGDALLAAALSVVALGDMNAQTTATPLLAWAVSVPVLLALVWRRRAPATVAVAVCGLDAWLSATAPGEFPPQLVLLAVMLSVYTLGAWSGGRSTAVGGAVTLVLVAAGHALTGDGDSTDFLPYVLWLAPFAAGRMVRRRTLQAAAAATEAAQLRARREQDVREAQAQERDRIARELHDVVAHAVSLMVVQAGAERLRLGEESPRTRAVLTSVETVGRHALTDLRQMLGVLRRADDGASELAPQPLLTDVPALVAGVRAAGLPVTLDEPAAGTTLPASLELSAYRIVQEALTNVVKHAGTVPTTVAMSVDADGLAVVVSNDTPVGPPAQRSPDGRGLLGMRERAAVHGGHVEAGPEGDRWVVRALLPVGAAVP